MHTPFYGQIRRVMEIVHIAVSCLRARKFGGAINSAGGLTCFHVNLSYKSTITSSICIARDSAVVSMHLPQLSHFLFLSRSHKSHSPQFIQLLSYNTHSFIIIPTLQILSVYFQACRRSLQHKPQQAFRLNR